jgi:hypothetical protein
MGLEVAVRKIFQEYDKLIHTEKENKICLLILLNIENYKEFTENLLELMKKFWNILQDIYLYM